MKPRSWLLILALVALAIAPPAGWAESLGLRSEATPWLKQCWLYFRELAPLPGSVWTELGRLKFVRWEGRSGAWYRDDKGQLWYLKPDEKHAELQTAAEVIASGIYRRLGYLAPETHIVKIKGKRYSAAKEIGKGGKEFDSWSGPNTPEYRKLRIFAAFLKDWDRVQPRNNFLLPEGRFATIDFGGALGSRAQGDHKPGKLVSPAIGAFEATNDARAILDDFNLDHLPADHPWRNLTRADVLDAINDLNGLGLYELEKIVDSARYSNYEDRQAMLAALRSRRNALIEQLPKLLLDSPAASRAAPAPDLAALLDKTFAVHATDLFPSDGILRSGGTYQPGMKTPTPEKKSIRPTVHFSLGELVRPHSRGSWEDREFAVVTPLRNIQDQLANLNPVDSYVFGDYPIPPGAILLVPQTEKRIEAPKGVRIVTYDPSQWTLRQAINRVIEKEGGWRFTMGTGSNRDRAYFGDQDVGQPGFYAKLLEKRPYLTFQLHSQSTEGMLESLVYDLADEYHSSHGTSSQRSSTSELRLKKTVTEEYLRRFETELSQRPLSKPALESVQKHLHRARAWLNLFNEDLALRDQYGVTLVGLHQDQMAELLERTGHPEDLRSSIQKLRTEGRLAEATRKTVPGQKGSWITALVRPWISLPRREVEKLLSAAMKSEPKLAEEGAVDGALARYALERALAMDPEQVRGDDLARLFQESVRRLSKRAPREKHELELLRADIQRYETELSPQGKARLDALKAAKFFQTLSVDPPGHP